MSDDDRRKWSELWAVPRLRHGAQSLALALLMAGITVAAVRVFGGQARARRGFGRSSALPASAASSTTPLRLDLSHDQRLVAVPSEPEEPAPSQTSSPNLLLHRSASELFAAATQARTQGDTLEAIRLSKQIEEFFPNSEEGKNSHLSLGVLYLRQDRAALALQEFAAFRVLGSPELKAEAYFGQSQALRKLGRLDDERIVLEELLRSYPRSIYVAAGRTRLAELTPDAAAH